LASLDRAKKSRNPVDSGGLNRAISDSSYTDSHSSFAITTRTAAAEFACDLYFRKANTIKHGWPRRAGNCFQTMDATPGAPSKPLFPRPMAHVNATIYT
jgi:hypothetical protein